MIAKCLPAYTGIKYKEINNTGTQKLVYKEMDEWAMTDPPVSTSYKWF